MLSGQHRDEVKILHILDHSLPLHSGYAFRSHNIFRCQQGVGFEPVVVTSPKHEASLKRPQPHKDVIDGVRYYRTGAVNGRRRSFLGEGGLILKLYKTIRKTALKERPHIIHAHSPVLNAIPAIRVARELGIPVAYEIRAFWEDAASDHGTYTQGSLKYTLVRKTETLVCRNADAIVTICDGLKCDLLKRGAFAAKITVVPNAVDPEEFSHPQLDRSLVTQWGLDGALVVGFLGSFYHYEGLDLLLHAVSRLAPKIPRLKVLLVGGGPMEQTLRSQARQLGIEDKVIFAGRLSHDQIPGAYSLVDVLAYPRKSMRLTELVTPLKPLEAMIMGIAQIASDVGGHRELIQDRETGLFFRAGDISALADSLSKLFGDPDLRLHLGENGRNWVLSQRTWSQNAQIYSALYGNLLQKRRNMKGLSAE